MVPKQLVYYLSLMILFEISSRSFLGPSCKPTEVTHQLYQPSLLVVWATTALVQQKPRDVW